MPVCLPGPSPSSLGHPRVYLFPIFRCRESDGRCPCFVEAAAERPPLLASTRGSDFFNRTGRIRTAGNVRGGQGRE